MGGNLIGVSDDEQTTAMKQTQRETFPLAMEVGIPWKARLAVIETHARAGPERWSARSCSCQQRTSAPKVVGTSPGTAGAGRQADKRNGASVP